MPLLRWGPGPVFVHESIAATRRWQLYALRAFFVLGLLAGLALTWFLAILEVAFINGKSTGTLTVKELASLGQFFYFAIATVQLVLVLLVAPAATAGSICLDRARGTLTHMLVTDLTDSEIVLGKLAARLLPVLSLVVGHGARAGARRAAGRGHHRGDRHPDADHRDAGRLRLQSGDGDLGPGDEDARSADGCLRNRGHLGVGAMYLGSPGVERSDSGVPAWFMAINPFVLAWAPYAWPKYLTVEQLAAVLGGTLALSGGLVIYAVLRLRADLTNRRAPDHTAGLVAGQGPREAGGVAAGAVAR